MSSRIIVVMALAVAMGGCYGFNVASPDDRRNPTEVKSTESVAAKSFDGISANVVRTGRQAGRLTLVCEGEYEIKRERMEKGVLSGNHVLTVGFCPGLKAKSKGVNGVSCGKWLGACCEVILMNCLVGIPTFVSLFYEPFDSYHTFTSIYPSQGCDCDAWSRFASQGLLGCCKWRQCDDWKEDYEKRDKPPPQIVSSYVLTDYTVSVDGVRYSCASPAMEIEICLPEGKSTVSVLVERVPALTGELGRCVDSLVGFEFKEIMVQAPTSK